MKLNWSIQQTITTRAGTFTTQDRWEALTFVEADERADEIVKREIKRRNNRHVAVRCQAQIGKGFSIILRVQEK